MIIKRRTFEAKKYAKGSDLRNSLNLSPVHSEYMPSYKYVICEDTGKSTCYTFRTKAEAEAKLAELVLPVNPVLNPRGYNP